MNVELTEIFNSPKGLLNPEYSGGAWRKFVPSINWMVTKDY